MIKQQTGEVVKIEYTAKTDDEIGTIKFTNSKTGVEIMPAVEHDNTKNIKIQW